MQIAAAGLCAGLLLHGAMLLAGPPLRGTADNGDFWRVGMGAGLAVEDDLSLRNRYVPTSFDRGEGRLADAFGSAALLVRLAAELPPRDPRRVELPRIGLFYLFLATVAFAVAIARGSSPVACAAIAWVLISPDNLLLLNSLYADAAAVVGTLAVVLGLARRPGWSSEALVLGGVFASAWSKQLHAGIGLAAALALMVRRPPGDRLPTAAMLAGLVTLGAVVHFGAGPGLRFPRINGYHAVFAGVAEVSSDPGRVLREHGLSDHADRVGTSFFTRSVPPELAARVEAVSRTQVALQYLRDPRALRRTVAVVRRALVRSDRYLGNHGRSARDAGAEIYREAWAFEGLREAVLGPEAALALGALFAIAWALRRARPWRLPGRAARSSRAPSPAVVFLVLAVALECVAAVLGDGFFALGRHLLVARFALDLLLALALAWALERALRAALGPALPLRPSRAR